MIEAIRNYNSQFEFVPKIENEYLLNKNFKHIVMCGMGGSHLPSGILKTIAPGIDIYVHRDYDLPPYEKSFLENSILIASSYSGNTEEVFSFYNKIKQLYDLPVLCITKGGKLLELAQTNKDPYIVLPDSEFEPRTALGFSSLALAFVLKDKQIYNALLKLKIPVDELEKKAQEVYTKFFNKKPIFYTSQSNMHLAYNWKIKCNETAKMHAFYNVFPESNHNELEAYEFLNKDTDILPVILHDLSDDSRTLKRFEVFEALLVEKGLDYLKIDISNKDVYQKTFCCVVLGDFITVMIAQENNTPIAEVPLIEEFKKRII